MHDQDSKTLTIPQFINKPTAAVHIRNSYTATERKLLNICLYEGINNSFSSDFYYIQVWETLQLLGCEKSKNSAWLKNELFESLRKKPIRWNVFKKDRRLQEWTCSFLSAYIDDPGAGRIGFQFNPVIVRHFQQRQLYSKLFLQIQAPIKSAYALSLYEFLNDELHRHRAHRRDLLVSLEDLRTLFDLKEGQYTEFKHFNNQAIKPAFLEINTHTDISIKSQQIRERRRVSGLQLNIQRRKNFQLSFNVGADSLNNSDSSALDENSCEVQKLLEAYGISSKKAIYMAGNFDVQRIVANLKYALEKVEKGGICNFPSFLIKAVEDNYMSNIDSNGCQKTIDEAWSTYQSKRMEERFNQLSQEAQTRLKDEYEHSIKNDAGSQIAKQKFNYEDGWRNQFIQHDFRKKVLIRLLQSPEETNIEAFSEWWFKQEIKQLRNDAPFSKNRALCAQ
ncbi:replication initiation protein [Oscillatoria sp. CS-180]|uniref:replication initiation protein n=1 Tax=Oscillatoria sp. CS-180 TaxID=3021720 RepID=UPI00232C9B15|nr:replication initiation protein [Oscillatoria sp. CS-180]MDB9529074.1 replication initiation protein [Oscillatoria sp. CS-180]